MCVKFVVVKEGDYVIVIRNKLSLEEVCFVSFMFCFVCFFELVVCNI